MTINNWNNSDEKLEKNKKNTWDDIRQFKKNFVKYSLEEKTWADKNNFIHEIMTKDTLSSTTNIKKELKKYAAINDEYYSDINIDNITIESLRRFLSKDFLVLKNSRENLKEKVLSDFDINSNEYDTNKQIQKHFNDLTKKQLDDLIKSDQKLTNFLNKNLSLNLTKREKFKVFANISSPEQEVEKRLAKLKKPAKTEVLKIIQNYNYSKNLSDIDIKILFSNNFFKKEEKAEFIHTFIPFITLEKAVDIWLLTDKEAKKKKTQINKEILKKQWVKDSYIKEMSEYLELNDIKISTYKINDENLFDAISEKIWFKNFNDELKELDNETKNRIKKEWPKNLYELSKTLNTLNKGSQKFKNTQKFLEWNFIEFTSTDSENKITKGYVKIISNNEKEKKFSYIPINLDNKIMDIKWIWKSKHLFYGDFLNKCEKMEETLDFFTKKEMQEKIETWELKSVDFDLISEDDLQNNPKKKKNIEEKYKIKLKKEIDFLKKRKDAWKTISQNQLTNIENNLNEIENWNITLKTLLNFENFERLLEKLDKIDPDWKNITSKDWRKWLFKWMIFKTKKWWFYEITWINDWMINIENTRDRSMISSINYSHFYEAFSKEKVNRLEYFEDLWDLKNKWIDDKLWWKDFKNNWVDHEFVNWQLIAKNVEDWDNTGVEKKVEYLVSDLSNEIIKIISTSQGMVEIQRWTRQNLDNMEKKKAKKLGWKSKDIYWNYEEEVLYIKWADKHNISISELNILINKYNLYPSWQTGKVVNKKTQKWIENDFGLGIWSKIFSNYSVYEVIMGWNMLVESIKETLKKWNEIHIAKAALAMWRLIPGDFRRDLQIKVEDAEKSEMDKEIEDLWKVDSPIAIARIKKWLLNRDIPEHKKQAWMLFMLEKYWHLSAKTSDMYAFRWKWLWYEAFGWRKNDKFFMQIKNRCKKTWVSFSEEFLMLHFLKAQCKEAWYNWIKRRTRLHKEFEYKWTEWVEAEFEKWYKDASNKRTSKEMVFEWLEIEALSWTTSNAIWWFKKVIERWWSLELLSEWFFCLLYAGVFNNIDQKSFLKMKDLWSQNWYWIIMTRFASSNEEVGIFNDTVLELSKRIKTMYWWKYNWIEKEAQEIYDSVKNNTWNEENRMKKTIKFWHKYDKVLVRALNMVNTSDSTYSESDNLIFLEKDDNGSKGETFTKYLNLVRKNYTAEENAFNSKIMNDGLKWAWVTWLNVHELSRRYLCMNTSQNFKDDTTWPNVWNEIYWDIKSINNKIFVSNNSELDKKAKQNIYYKY